MLIEPQEQQDNAKWWYWLLVALAPALVRAALIPWWGVPFPVVMDEFGHFLLADTLLHGRLANPPHPLHEHFETFYVLQDPAYSAIYPTGWASFVAMGRLLGHPFNGVLISGSLYGISSFWALRSIFRARVALPASILSSIWFGSLSYWMDGYLFGMPQAAGGALFAAGLYRWFRSPQWAQGAAAAAGWSIWWLTRPAEAVFGAIAALVVVTVASFRNRDRPLVLGLKALCLGAFPVLAATLLLTLAHNRAVSGDPLVLPYVHAQQKLGVPQSFVFLEPIPRPPTTERVHMKIYESQLEDRLAAGQPIVFLKGSAQKLWITYGFYCGIALALCVGAAAYYPGLSLLSLWSIGLFGVLALLECLYVFWMPHYIAGGLILVVVAYAESIVLLSKRFSRPLRSVAPLDLLLLGAIMVLLALQVFGVFAGRQKSERYMTHVGRQRIMERLFAEPGSHLILMDDRPMVERFYTWIYNDADIDHSKVVWARAISPEKDRRLLEYFNGRTLWTVIIAEGEPRLLPLRSSGESDLKAGVVGRDGGN